MRMGRGICITLHARHIATLLLVVSLAGFLLAGCATESATHIQQPFVPRAKNTVRIEPCENRSGFSGDRDIAGEATRTLTEKLQASKLFEVAADAPMVLTCDVEQFSEGSALKRWALAGGATQATVSAMVWEDPDQKVLATFRSHSAVRSGGLYSIGADQYILSVAFDDIVKQLEAWATGANQKPAP